MSVVFCILLLKILILIVIVWQDAAYRAVYWFLFPALLLLEIVSYSKSIVPFEVYLLNAGLNCSVIIIQVAVLFVYFRLVRKIENIFEQAFGLGDLLMLFCFAFAFPFAGFILFCLITFLFSILLVWMIKAFKKDISVSIPLAGIQAGIYALLLLINQWYAIPLLSLNYWLFNFMHS